MLRPVNNFYPQKRERKKEEEKKKNIAILLGGRYGLSRFFDKIRPERSEVWRLWQKPGGLDLYCPKRGLVLAALSLLDFYFLVGEYYTKN